MALILTRKTGEEILIGDNIKIRVIEICSKNNVRLAIEAPSSVQIWRPEVLERIKAQEDQLKEG